jgi:glycosyltransferase involved in cell wall biosynthesis
VKVWVDAKNPALHSGGISVWLGDLLDSLEPELLDKIVLVYPRIDGVSIFPHLKVKRLELPWISWLPRKVAQVLYDNIVFRLFATLEKPAVVFSPYFDITIPKDIPSYITIHDLCFQEVPWLYSRNQRTYYEYLMKKSINRARGLITVSNTTRDQLIEKMGISSSSIQVISNKINNEFANFLPTLRDIESFKSQFDAKSIKILYTGGFERRKNLSNLLEGLRLLLEENKNYILVVTGSDKAKWLELLKEDNLLSEKIRFLGHLTTSHLKTAYVASDVVVYPSFSEGFGRSCIEAMSVGTPLACTNLKVFREVTGEYPVFFDPEKPKDIARAISDAIQIGKKIPSENHAQNHASEVSHLSRTLLNQLVCKNHE